MNYPVGKRTKARGSVGLYVYRGKGLVNDVPKLCYYFTWGRGRFVKVGWNYEGYTLQHAADQRALFIRSMRHGENPNKRSQMLLKDAWNEYMGYVLATNSTVLRVDKSYWSNHLSDLGTQCIDHVTAPDIKRVLGKAERDGLAVNTRAGILSTAKRIFGYLVDSGKTTNNPTTGIRVKGESVERKRYLELQEIRTVLNLISTRIVDAANRSEERSWRETRAQFILGVEMGLRRSEMFTVLYEGSQADRDYSLTWDRIDLSNKQVTIIGKGKKIRNLKLTRNACEALVALGPKKNGRVFTKLHNVRINAVLNEAGINDGIKDHREAGWVSMHTLRHTFATYAVKQTRDLQVVAALLGHATTNVTERYAHLIKGADKKAMDSIEQIFESTPTGKIIAFKKA